ncbi:acyltransferase 3 [Candidatus Paraburkholderia calva]|nr:acyltransferase 3 [Candidatus Paraburkholderia calva]
MGVWETPRTLANAFYLPWGRAWEFMTGAAIALVAGSRSRVVNDMLALAGVALLLAAIFGFTPGDPYPGWRALVPFIGTALVIYARDGLLTRTLSSRPLQFVGDISYSVYLWHWPMLVAFRKHTGADPEPW